VRLCDLFHPTISPVFSLLQIFSFVSRRSDRRSYDRSLAVSGGEPHHHHHYHHHPSPTTSLHYATANEGRRRSANYAWERRRRPPPGSNPHTTSHHPRSHPSGFASNDLHAQRAADSLYYRPPRTGWKETELDRVNRVSGLGRAVQLVGLFIAVAIVGTLGKS
jgi:hypothetical protein